MNLFSRLPRLLDRDLIIWGVVPCAFASAIVTMFALPNYLRATALKDDAQYWKALTEETVSAQNNLRRMEQMVSTLREERDRRCRPLGNGVERDRLLGAIARTTDGHTILEQSIRTGQVMPSPGMPANFQVLRRDVTVDMVGSFDAIFGVIDAAESVDQLVSTRSVEISVTSVPEAQATTGSGIVRAVIVFEEWFQPSQTPAGTQENGVPADASPSAKAPGTSPIAMNGGNR